MLRVVSGAEKTEKISACVFQLLHQLSQLKIRRADLGQVGSVKSRLYWAELS